MKIPRFLAFLPTAFAWVAFMLNAFCWTPAARAQAGSLDSGFATDFIVGSPVTRVAVQPDGKVLIVGLFTAIGEVERNYIARLHADGSLDAGFTPPLIESYDTRSDSTTALDSNYQVLLQTVVLQADGKILIGGNFYFVNGAPGYGGLVRLNADGSVDNSFNPPRFSGTVNAIVPTRGGKFYVGGDFSFIDSRAQNALARLNADGSLDEDFDARGVAGQVINEAGAVSNRPAGVRALALQSDGNLLAGGNFSSVGGVSRRGIARLKDDGSLDESFQAAAGLNPVFEGTTNGSDSEVRTIVVQPDGRILVGGNFLQPSLDPITGLAAQRNALFRLNRDGAFDASFQVGVGTDTGAVNAIALQTDGKILIGGGFVSYAGQPQGHVARVNADGSLDANFDTGIGANNDVLSLALAGSNQLVAGGFFNVWNEVLRPLVVRVNLAADAPPGIIVTISPAVRPAREEGSSKGRFVVRRAGGNLAVPLTVNFQAAGTATSGADYSLFGKWVALNATGLGGTLQIPGGRATASINALTVDDQEKEDKETVVLTLTPSAAYGLGAASSAKIKIIDND